MEAGFSYTPLPNYDGNPGGSLPEFGILLIKIIVNLVELSSINQYFGNIDIYLLDQILKKRFHMGMKVLDAGCGEGRNLMYFLRSGFSAYGVDRDAMAIEAVQFIAASFRPDLSRDHFQVAEVENLPFEDSYFDLLISSAVLHFANNQEHFLLMFEQMLRCLKPGGILFMRMASDIGIEDKIMPENSGRYRLPDGTTRFLLTRNLLSQLERQFSFKYLEPFKTVNVDDKRCMSTLVATRQ